jgi:transcriptional regulator with XRE-family HTH domain
MPQVPNYKLKDLHISDKDIGQNIANLRKKRGLTQKELADQIGISQSLLSHYEIGRLHLSSLMIIKIAKSLKISADKILGINSNNQDDAAVHSLKIIKRLKKIDQLSSFEQKALLKTIDNFLKGAENK